MAVCTSRQKSADAAASAFGASHAFSDYRVLVLSPDIDAVTIAVRVPWHREMALAALAAGKHVIIELEVPGRFRLVPADVPSTSVLNVAYAYKEFAQAIACERSAAPDFAYGLNTLNMLAAFERSGEEGRRLKFGS